jgi:hypothetical protein
MQELSKRQEYLFSTGVKLVFVHMAENEVAESYFTQYNFSDVAHISDPTCKFYLAFGLVKAKFSQLMGLRTIMRGFDVSLNAGIIPNSNQFINASQLGDGLQMPGIFLISQGQILESFIHKFAADKPDYEKLLNCCVK